MAALSTISVNCPSDLFDVANKDMMDISEKAAAEGKRRRKSAMRDFRTQEEYEKFAKSRNAATKRCRQKKEEELRILREENPVLREENARLARKVDTLEKEKVTEVKALRGRVARLERELADAISRLNVSPSSLGDGCKEVTLPLRSDKKVFETPEKKEEEAAEVAEQDVLGDIFNCHFDEFAMGDESVDELDVSFMPPMTYEPALDPFRPEADVEWG